MPELADLVEQAQAQRPAYIHFPLVIGRNQHKDWDFAAIENWLKTTATDFVNSHITPSKPRFAETIGLDDLSHALIKEVEILVKRNRQQTIAYNINTQSLSHMIRE